MRLSKPRRWTEHLEQGGLTSDLNATSQRGFKETFRESRQASRRSANGRSEAARADLTGEAGKDGASTDWLGRRCTQQAAARGGGGGGGGGLLASCHHASEVDLTCEQGRCWRVGPQGLQRSERRGLWEGDLLGRYAALPAVAAATPSSHGEDASLDVHSDVVAFVARRVYRRLRDGARGKHSPPFLGLFDELCFDGLRALVGRVSMTSLWRFLCPCLPDVEPIPTAADVFRFLHGFTTWCALPTDLLLVALVYLDRLLDKCQHGNGILTARCWRPVLTVCVLLASKMWEDWCVCNAEVAKYLGFAADSMLCWELSALAILEWRTNISADVYAPYFWAANHALRERRDEKVGTFTGPLSEAERARLSELAQGVPVTLVSRRPLTGASGHVYSLDDVRHRIAELPESSREKFVCVGRLEDRYQFLETLGRGSYGEVKLAVLREDAAGSGTRAVKLFGHAPAGWVRASDLLAGAFVLTGVSLSLHHPNIVRFLEYVVDERRFLLGREPGIVPVMEALTGPDLHDWLSARQAAAASRGAPWIGRGEVANIVAQALRGLAYIHGNSPPLVHRDVKPKNLQWASCATGAHLKLVDFGTVYVGGYPDALQGQLVGTPLYMAPEALEIRRGAAGVPAASLDMFAMGMVLDLLLSGCVPRSARSPRWRRARAAGGKAAGTPWNLVPPAGLDLEQALLHRRPERRPSAERALAHPFFQEADKWPIQFAAHAGPAGGPRRPS